MDLNKRIALIATGSLLSVGGLYAVSTAANAASHVAPVVPAASSPAAGTATVDATEANDPADATEANDPADATEANDPADATEANDPADATEANDPADANEAGHQDAPGADDATEVNDSPENSGK